MTDAPHDKSGSGSSGEGSGHGAQPKKSWPPIIKIFLTLCVVLLVLDFDFVLGRPEVHSKAEEVYAFYPLYGFVACVLLVLAATQMRRVLMRKEDYYDAD